MDNLMMTPNKIQRWMKLAQDKSLGQLKIDYNGENARVPRPVQKETASSVNCEISSGILNLESVEDFEEFEDVAIRSCHKSTTFDVGEMGARSTGTEKSTMSKTMPLCQQIEKLESELDSQTSEVKNILRNSICTNYSFHSKRDLSKDEASFVQNRAPLPVNTQQSLLSETNSTGNENLSMGTYFQKRCTEFGKILENINSPDRIKFPIATEVCNSEKTTAEGFKPTNNPRDQSLDSVPVRQPRDVIPSNPKGTEQLISSSNTNESQYLPYTGGNFTEFKKPPPAQLAPPKFASTAIDLQKYFPTNADEEIISSCQPLRSPIRMMSEESEGTENSISLSKIADYIGNQSHVSITGLLNNKANQPKKKSPLAEVQINVQENKINNQESQATQLQSSQKSPKDSRHLNCMKNLDNLKINPDKDAIEVFHSADSLSKSRFEEAQSKSNYKSRSPLSKSPSTLSTVRDNFASFKSEDSTAHFARGNGSNSSYVPSPNINYRELDSSVDWGDVLRWGSKQHGLAKEQWVNVTSTPAKGFVGVCSTVVISVTNLVDSWITAKFDFSGLQNGNHLTIELPRQPLLLSPRKTEQFNFHLTSTMEMKGTLPYSLFLKDSSVESDIEVKQTLEVDIQIPVVQAMSLEGMNKISFPPVQEKAKFVKFFVLLSDCPADLQLELSVVEGESIFAIKNIQEIKRCDVKKVLMERQGSTEDQSGKVKAKVVNKQLCRLTSGNAIKVTMLFSAPKLSDLQIKEPVVTFNGKLHVNLIDVSSVLRKVDLIGIVGHTKLMVNAPTEKLCLSNEPTRIVLSNSGAVPGSWVAKFRSNSTNVPFQAVPSRTDICAGGTKTVSLTCTGSDDSVYEGVLVFEDLVTGQKTTLEVSGRTEKSKSFPIKTNFRVISWVQPGRKELSLKNSTDRRVHVRCQLLGDGFWIDLPGGESRGIYSLRLDPCECRPLAVIFAPKTILPQKAELILVSEKNGGLTRKIKLFGCSSGEPMRWSGLVTYGNTALVRAVSRAPVVLQLYNKSAGAAFIYARLHFNLQYWWAEQGSTIAGGRDVVAGRARHHLTLTLDWTRLERRARHAPPCALATVYALTGHEMTRRRILRICRNKSTGEIDTSLLPEHLKILAEKFNCEDPSMDELLDEFGETESSLNELIGGLHELTAQIDLPQDYPDETTIIINDETILEHHTLCE